MNRCAEIRERHRDSRRPVRRFRSAVGDEDGNTLLVDGFDRSLDRASGTASASRAVSAAGASVLVLVWPFTSTAIGWSLRSYSPLIQLAGKDPVKPLREIADNFKMPPSLANVWANRGYYGSVYHDVAAIYVLYLGWFTGNPAKLTELVSYLYNFEFWFNIVMP